MLKKIAVLLACAGLMLAIALSQTKPTLASTQAPALVGHSGVHTNISTRAEAALVGAGAGAVAGGELGFPYGAALGAAFGAAYGYFSGLPVAPPPSRRAPASLFNH